jgi:hypothetical protein
MRFCVHLMRNSVNIYRNEKCFSQNVQRNMKYRNYTFSVSHAVLRIVKQNLSKRPEFLWSTKRFSLVVLFI